MSIPFTPVTDGLDWQSLSFLGELQLAWNERRYAVGHSSIGWVSAGTDIQAVSFWSRPDEDGYYVDGGIQSWLEKYCVRFLDYEQPLDPFPDQLTLAVWRTRACLHADGFRRATTWPADWTNPDDPAYMHGQMQAGDIIGPWVLQDVQRGLSALRWSPETYYDPVDEAFYGIEDKRSISTPGRKSKNISVSDATWDLRRAAWNTAFAADNWVSGGSDVYLWLEVISNYGGWDGDVRDAGAVHMTLSAPPCPFTPVLYADLNNDAMARPYVDFRGLDGLGRVMPPWDYPRVFIHEAAEVTGSEWNHASVRTALPAGNWSTSLIDTYPYTNPTEPYGCQALQPTLLFKWNFTNSG